MLSWSGTESGVEIDLAALGRGEVPGGERWTASLLRFAEAAVGRDDESLATARDELVAEAGTAVMIDAAAVAANFEMMTRLADGTGARFADDRAAANAPLAAALGVGDVVSRR